MNPRRVVVHYRETTDGPEAYPALLVDTRYRETEHPGTIARRTMRVEEALIIRLDPDEETAYSYDWVPLGRVEDAEDDIRGEARATRIDIDTSTGMLKDALDAYRADPVDARDRPESWGKLNAVLYAADEAVRQPGEAVSVSSGGGMCCAVCGVSVFEDADHSGCVAEASR